VAPGRIGQRAEENDRFEANKESPELIKGREGAGSN
jgi:hypothetical protein